jgi:hypothetical protein
VTPDVIDQPEWMHRTEEWHMYGKQTTERKKFGISMMAAALLLGAALAGAQEPSPDSALARWLGTEFTVESSRSVISAEGGKLTLVFDADENLVHVCTRNSSNQDAPWRMDFATPCGVTMSFTRGTRYCTIEDVKTGNAEVLASCHRLRTHDIAMRPSKTKGAVERHDMVAFLVQLDNGKPAMSIIVDSPARVTDNPGHHRHRALRLRLRPFAQRLSATLLPFAAAATFGASFAVAAAPNLCDHGGRWTPAASRAPRRVVAYLDSLGNDRFDLRAACAHWAGTFSKRHQTAANNLGRPEGVRATDRVSTRGAIRASSSTWLKQTGDVTNSRRSRNFVVATFLEVRVDRALIAVINAPKSDTSSRTATVPD